MTKGLRILQRTRRERSKTYSINIGCTLCAALTIQTFGDYAKWHPHIHAIVADGLFRRSGVFQVMHRVIWKRRIKIGPRKSFPIILPW